MLVLPDYIVLDFLEWISQNYPRNNGFLGPLLYDEKIAMSYAEKYLHREYGGSKVYGYKQCKYGDCNGDFYDCMHYCVYRCYHEFEYFLHDRFVELREQPRYELKGIEP